MARSDKYISNCYNAYNNSFNFRFAMPEVKIEFAKEPIKNISSDKYNIYFCEKCQKKFHKKLEEKHKKECKA